MNRRATAPACCLAALLLAAPALASHWSTWSEENNPVTDAHFLQNSSVAVSDGEGGVIVAWQDLRNELYYYIYAQRLNANGDPVWTTDGVRLSTSDFNQVYPQIVSDGAGGAIVVWIDQRADTGDLYAQRIDASGNVLWNPAGVPLAVAASVQTLQEGIADGAGGAIWAWTDLRTESDIYAQRIDASGAVQWTANGVVISAAAGSQLRANLATDRAQGAIIAWEDHRNDPTFSDVYAQRVLADGTRAWTTHGVPVAVQPWYQRRPVVSYCIGNGAFIAWEDSRAGGTDFQIYHQRLYSSGAPAFTVNGVQVSTIAGGDNYRPQIADSRSSYEPQGTTVYIVWEHETAGGDRELVLKERYPSGITTFDQLIDFGDGDKLDPHVTTSEGGGVLIAWTSDSFYGPGASNVFFTKFHGSFEFGSSGIRVCAAGGPQGPVQIVSDHQGGAILAWDDERDGPGDSDVMAQRVDFIAALGYSSADITSVTDHPNDQGGRVIVSWTPSVLDVFDAAYERQYSVWRRLAEVAPAAARAVAQDTRIAAALHARAIEAGVSAQVADQQIASGWELVGTVPPVGLPSYALTCASYGDSTESGVTHTEFMVVFQVTGIGNWFSAARAGYSVDDLTPLAPLQLAGVTSGLDAQLTWQQPNASPDVVAYNVYRETTPGVAVTPANRIATVADLSHLDATTLGATHYYVVTAVDDAMQEGPPSNEVAAPIGVTGVDDAPPASLTLFLLGRNPAPRGPSVRFGLPAAADVVIESYDVTGRQVREIRLGRMSAGWHEHHLEDSGAPLRSGAYFVRVRAGSETRKASFVVIR